MDLRSSQILRRFHQIEQNKQKNYDVDNPMNVLRQKIFQNSVGKDHAHKSKQSLQISNRQKENNLHFPQRKSKKPKRKICDEFQIIDLSQCCLSQTEKKMEDNYSLQEIESWQRQETHQALVEKGNNSLNENGIQLQNVMGLEIKHLSGQRILHITNPKVFAQSMISSGYFIRCRLKRPSALNKLFENKFLLYLQDGIQIALTAKRGYGQQLFKIFLGNSTEQSNYLCSMISNTIADKFWITTPIKNLKVLCHQQQKIYDMKRIYLTINYEKLTKKVQQRQMKIFLPPQTKNCQYVVLGQVDEDIFKSVNQKSALQLQLSKNVNNWKIQSDKNCVLIDKKDDFEYLRMEKVDSNIFALLIGHPLTLIQGFAIALSRFQAQLK